MHEAGAVVGVIGLCALTMGGFTWLAKAALTKMMERKVQDHIANLAMERDAANLELSIRLEDHKNQLLNQSQQFLEGCRTENQKNLAAITSRLAEEVNKNSLIHSRVYPRMEEFIKYGIPAYNEIGLGIIEALTGKDLDNYENRMALLKKWEDRLHSEKRKLYDVRMDLPKDLNDAFMSFVLLGLNSLNIWYRHFVDYPELDDQELRIPEIREIHERERDYYKRLIIANADNYLLESQNILNNLELISRKRLAVDIVFS